MALGAKNEDVGLYAHALQLFDRVLGGFGLQFVCRFQIGHIGEMHAHGVLAQLPAQLSDGFHEGGTLDVADGAAHFGDDEVDGVLFPWCLPLSILLLISSVMWGTT